MQIDSAHVGTRLIPHRAVVDWRWMTNYAAAVGDANPCYLDDTRSAGIIAHPVFPVAVTWPVTLHLDRYMEGSSFPVALMAMQVHHSEHIALHRPIRPGQHLTVAGTVAVDPLFSYRYDAGGGIVFPIHTSPAFARGVGLPGIIVQGTATLALAVRELVNREAGGDPQRIAALACRFSGMVQPGTTILVVLQHGDGNHLFFAVRDAQGQRVLSNGHAWLMSR